MNGRLSVRPPVPPIFTVVLPRSQLGCCRTQNLRSSQLYIHSLDEPGQHSLITAFPYTGLDYCLTGLRGWCVCPLLRTPPVLTPVPTPRTRAAAAARAVSLVYLSLYCSYGVIISNSPFYTITKRQITNHTGVYGYFLSASYVKQEERL